jgi:hypothetical protein
LRGFGAYVVAGFAAEAHQGINEQTRYNGKNRRSDSQYKQSDAVFGLSRRGQGLEDVCDAMLGQRRESTLEQDGSVPEKHPNPPCRLQSENSGLRVPDIRQYIPNDPNYGAPLGFESVTAARKFSGVNISRL